MGGAGINWGSEKKNAFERGLNGEKSEASHNILQ